MLPYYSLLNNTSIISKKFIHNIYTIKISSMSSVPNPIFSLVWFLGITVMFFIIRYITADTYKLIFFVIYIFLLIIGEFFINLQLTSAICGTNQTGTALIVTFIPWLVIFGLLNVLLIVFKGWKQPFSNTFGYLTTRLMGISGLLDEILKSQSDNSVGKAGEGLENIYNDKSLFINEIPLEEYDSFWKNMQDYFKPEAFSNAELKDKLKMMVFLKDLVAEFVWFSLTGCLVTSVAFNYIANTTCTKSVKEMHKQHESTKNKNAAQHEKNAGAPKPRIYTLKE